MRPNRILFPFLVIALAASLSRAASPAEDLKEVEIEVLGMT